jgi:predicted secreted protein
MSNAVSGVGTKFYRASSDSSDGHEWSAIAEVLSISGPSMTKGQIDVTNLDSTGGYREFITGFRDAGQVTMKMNFTRAGYAALKADYDSDTNVSYKIVLPEIDGHNPAIIFDAAVVELPLEISADAAITCNVTLKVSGAVTYGDDSSSEFL